MSIKNAVLKEIIDEYIASSKPAMKIQLKNETGISANWIAISVNHLLPLKLTLVILNQHVNFGISKVVLNSIHIKSGLSQVLSGITSSTTITTITTR